MKHNYKPDPAREAIREDPDLSADDKEWLEQTLPGDGQYRPNLDTPEPPPPPVDPANAPEPVLSGKFAIYEDGKGGFVLFTDTGDGPQQKHIPAALVKLATGGGVMSRRLAGIFG